MINMTGWRLEHTYTDLPHMFYADTVPTAVRAPRLVLFNRAVAATLGLDADALDTPDGAAIFAGNVLPPGSRPIAQAYAGHQYGHFTALGDGRAILLGEQITPAGNRVDIQLKGPGQTRFSRRGDGRAALGPMLREYIISEAMAALDIPTTRSLAVAATGEPVYRETVLEGAVLTRVAASHIRVGTMQWAAAHDDRNALQALAGYTKARHYAGIGDSSESSRTLFEAILERQASLIARWQLVGFIHGVMNTDNMALSGETIDYGPCAFMDAYDPATVFSSIDQGGRYAYGNQPSIAMWNLARLAEAMLPLFDVDAERAADLATASLERFPALFEQQWLEGMRAKLGLFTQEAEDKGLADDLLAWMHRRSADFTNTFRSLTAGARAGTLAAADPELEAWQQRLGARRERQPQTPADVVALMQRHNPAVIPRNHLVEAALSAATEGNDLSVLKRLLDVLSQPYRVRTRPAGVQRAGAGHDGLSNLLRHVAAPALPVPQRHRRIDPGRPPGRTRDRDGRCQRDQHGHDNERDEVERLDPEQHRADQPAAERRQYQADDRARRHDTDRARHDEAKDVARCRAKRAAHAEIAHPLLNRVREDAEHTDHRQRHGERRERRDHHRPEAMPPGGRPRDVLERDDVADADELLLVDARDRGPHGRHQGGGASRFRPNHEDRVVDKVVGHRHVDLDEVPALVRPALDLLRDSHNLAGVRRGAWRVGEREGHPHADR